MESRMVDNHPSVLRLSHARFHKEVNLKRKTKLLN